MAYHKLPEVLGGGVGYEVATEGEFDAALRVALADRDRMSLIQVHLDPNNRSEALNGWPTGWGRRCEEVNRLSPPSREDDEPGSQLATPTPATASHPAGRFGERRLIDAVGLGLQRIAGHGVGPRAAAAADRVDTRRRRTCP